MNAGEVSDQLEAIRAAEAALHATYNLPPSAATRQIQNDAWHALRRAREKELAPFPPEPIESHT